jgi:hypothetical protein
MSKTRSILIPLYPEDECDFSEIEILQAVHQEDLYRIKGFPFYASAIAPGDKVTATEDEGFLVLDKIIEASGNSVIQVHGKSAEPLEVVQAAVKALDCEAEFFNEEGLLLCIIVPASKSYAAVQQYLIKGFDEKLYDFREACISQHHVDKEGDAINLD